MRALDTIVDGGEVRPTVMHELGIATSILEAVQKEAERLVHPTCRGAQGGAPGGFVKVVLRIGELAGVDFDSLSFGWEAITSGTEWQGLRLEVEPRNWVNRCSQCSTEFRVIDYQTACPKCGCGATRLVSGDELDIAYIEVDEEPETASVRGGADEPDPS